MLSFSGTRNRQMGRVSQFEFARAMNDRAEGLRKIADGLTDNANRNFLLTVAEDCERRAKAAAYRVRHALARDPGASHCGNPAEIIQP